MLVKTGFVRYSWSRSHIQPTNGCWMLDVRCWLKPDSCAIPGVGSHPTNNQHPTSKIQHRFSGGGVQTQTADLRSGQGAGSDRSGSAEVKENHLICFVLSYWRKVKA